MNLKKYFCVNNRWCKNANAVNSDGHSLDLNFINRDDAQQVKQISAFSLYGAVIWYFPFENKEQERNRTMQSLRRAISAHTGKILSVAEFNNLPETTFDDIRKVLEIAYK